MSTSEWMRAMGAVRPMGPASHEVLVLGTWHRGHFPIMCICGQDGKPDKWWLFGVRTAEPVAQHAAVRIMSAIESAKKETEF